MGGTWAWLLAVGTMIPAPAVSTGLPQTAASEAAVRAALARRDLRAAGTGFNALVESRLPAKQANRPDPVLDRLLVEQLVAQGVEPPRPILARLAADTRAPDRVHNLLLLATVEESSGEAARARDLFVAANTSSGATMDQRLAAQLGLARLKLADEPAGAAAILRAIDPATLPAARRWEVDLHLARAIGIERPVDHAAQEAQLAKAWAEAPDADLTDGAVARVAGDRAILAGRSGDRARLVALLAVDRTNRLGNNGVGTVTSDLPVCGENGVGADDLAIIEARRIAAAERPAIGLVWANRVGVGTAFLDAARRSGQLTVTDGAVAHFALRCRAAPAIDYTVSARLMNDAISGWMTGKGAYPLVATEELPNVAQLAAILADRTTRYGTGSIMRLPVLLQLIDCLSPQIDADAQAQARVVDLLAQIAAVLERNDAPEDMKLVWQIGAIGVSVAAKTRTTAQAQAAFQALLVSAAANPAVSRDLLYGMANGLAAQANASTQFKEAVLTATLTLFDREPPQDPRARALALQLSRVRASNGDAAGAKAALAGRAFPADLCILANPALRVVSNDISSDDYPIDTLFTSIAGFAVTEADVDASGRAMPTRLLAADPPYLFDDATRRGIGTFRYDPPRRDGRSQGCRGVTLNVRWKMPD